MHARQGEGLAMLPAQADVRPRQGGTSAGMARVAAWARAGRRVGMGAVMATLGAGAGAAESPLPGPRACADWAYSATALRAEAKFRHLREACAGLLRPASSNETPLPPDPRGLPGWLAPILVDPPAPHATAPGDGAPLARRELPAPGEPGPGRSASARAVALAPLVDATARRHDIDPLLLHAIAHVESRHRSDARSPAGALGLMQVMPGTGQRFGVRDPRHLQQAATSLEVGAGYLKWLQRRFRNQLPLVLAAYNAGEGAVERHGLRIPPFPETQAYVRAVLSEYQRLRLIASALPAPASITEGAL